MTVTIAQQPGNAEDHKEPTYGIFVDDQEFAFDHSPITGAELMARAGISESTGLVEILEDGSQKSIGPNDEIELKPGRHVKKAPRFKRGHHE